MPMHPYVKQGNYLRQLRVARNLGQKEVAEGTGLSQAEISKLETGKGQAENQTRRAIAGFFGVPEADLVRGGPERMPNGGGATELPSVSHGGSHAPVASSKRVQVPILHQFPQLPKRFEEHEIDHYVDIPKDRVRGRRMYILKATGDFMDRAGIKDGDLLLVDADAEPLNGDVVVYRHQIRRFYRLGNRITLNPESSNSKHSPLIFQTKSELQIHGVVDSIYLKQVK